MIRQDGPAPLADRALGWGAAALGFAVALSRIAGGSPWRGDLPAVRDLGLVAVGAGGAVSTVAAQAAALLPLGSRVFRASLGSALALLVAAVLLHALAVHTVRAAAATGARVGSLIAAVATLTAALSPSWQGEATVGGGAMIATALALGAVTVGLGCLSPERERGPAPARRWIALGALVGATLAESFVAGMSSVAALGALAAARRLGDRAEGVARFRTPLRVLVASAGAAAMVAAVLLSPLALRPVAPRAWTDVGRALSSASLSSLDVAAVRTTALAAWMAEVGPVSLGIAAVGAAFGVASRRARPLIAPLLALLALDTLLPARAAGVLSADPWTSMRALAVAAIAVSSALGVEGVVAALLRLRVPLAKSAAVLVVVFHVTLVALASEEAAATADRSRELGAETWADEALGGVEPDAALLVRSPALAWRLWAARLTRGERPDVLIVPIALLDRGRVASSLVAAERRIEPLLRDYALTGAPSEFSLSKLADARPLHVELDRSWPKAIVSHLLVDGMWLEYAPQPLGGSDARVAAARSMAPLRRVLSAAPSGPTGDGSTGVILASTLRGHASVLAASGEREIARLFAERVTEVAPRGLRLLGGSVRDIATGALRALRTEPAARATPIR